MLGDLNLKILLMQSATPPSTYVILILVLTLTFIRWYVILTHTRVLSLILLQLTLLGLI